MILVLVIGAVIGISIAGTMRLANFASSSTKGRLNWTSAFYDAENCVQWMAQQIADSSSLSTSNYFSTEAGTLTLSYFKSTSNSISRKAWVSAVRTNASLPNVYLVSASARVGNKYRTVQAVITKNPPSQVFDYEYFLNNWGWWWGSTITGHGGNRANWDFDFRDKPTVNGVILANGTINSNNREWKPGDPVPFGGLAGTSPDTYVRAGVPRETMPNLKDFSYYEDKALASSSNGIWVGGTRLVTSVHSGAKTGLYLAGTDASPVKIVGTVVVPGDVVIKGKISGHGTLYVGGNLYVAGDMTYKNPPSWSVPPETMSPSQRDKWVADSKSKDLVVFAVREAILGGDVNSSDWKSSCYDAAGYGLKNIGGESNLGQDGISQTGDDGVSFVHEDGTKSAWFDADGDGATDGNYNYSSQLAMSSTRASKISGYPTSSGSPVAYSSVANNNMNLLDGVFYTNHAAAMRLARNNAVFHGSLISRDEAVIFSGSLTFMYDARVHSRYNANPNLFVDLDLPIAGRLSVASFSELAPNTAGL